MRRAPLTPLALLLCFLAAPALAQDRGGLSGRVSDKRTGHALPFASVTVMGAQKGGLTDSEGQFLITGLPPGTYDVRVQFLGYRLETRPGVVITSGKTAQANFTLEDIVVRQEKTVEVTAERRLVEVRQGATIRSVSAAEIRNLPVQTIGEVLQQQAGITSDADQIHVRGGRTDETVFIVNGVTNRDLVTGQSTAGQLNARSVAEINVATGAYDVRYGNALSGVVEVKLKEGTDRFEGGLTTTAGSFGGRAVQAVIGGPDPVWKPLLGVVGVNLPGTVSSILDISANFLATRFPNITEIDGRPRLCSSYEDALFGARFTYSDFFTPSEDNRWAARYGLAWKPNTSDKLSFSLSKRIAIDQGFSRVFLNASGDLSEPAYPWQWSRRIEHAPTIFEDNVQGSLQWRRTISTTGYTELQLSRYFFAQRQDVMCKHWSEFEEPGELSLPDSSQRADFFINSGDYNVWQDRRTLTYGLQWSLLQRLRRHELEVGFDHDLQTVQYLTVEDPWEFDPDGLGGAHDLWRVHPWVGNVYVRDRLEYEGFTANVGLRADYWFLGREAERALADTANQNISTATREEFFEDTHSFFGRRFKMHVSPRVIVAHPITENSSFFFNYGQFTQNPSYRYVYSKLTSVSSESFPLLGNPNLNPQVSVNYEVGAKHQFHPVAAVNATFFVKDIYDYPVATTFKRSQGESLVDIFVYLNGHFARSKGFEIEFEKRRSNHWSGKISYTFQQTKGKSSDANEQKIVQENGGDAAETRLSETFVRWNRPHKLAAHFDVRYDDEGPSGWSWLKHSGLNVFFQGEAGRAYTPINLVSTQAAEPFSKNGLFQTTMDLKVNRYLKIGGQRLDLSLAALNVFDNRVIRRVDRVTGEGRVWGEGEYDPRFFPDLNEYVRISEVEDPSNYDAGAQWRLALDYDF
ncbi:MAG TPA: TonB-dependent receptor [Candidatus Limnocylindria bacterium]|nr:TonB-dependent receptor [Candidatus Limnocylindria bacterium]